MKTFRNRYLQPLETADHEAIQTGDGVVEPEEGRHQITMEKNPQKMQNTWELRSNQRTPKASTTSYNQAMAKYYSIIGVTPCAITAAYQAIREPNVDSDYGTWTTASKDPSTPHEATYHPGIN